MSPRLKSVWRHKQNTNKMHALVSNSSTLLNYQLDTLLERGRKKWTRPQAFLALALFVVALAVYATMTTNVVINGDGALYADEITRGLLTTFPLHLGYYVLTFLFVQFAPFPAVLTLNLLNGFFGALTLVVVFRLALALTARTSVALVAALLLGVNYLFVFNAGFVEVYAAQTFFVLLAFQLWLSDHPLASGLAFAFAVVITPTSVLALLGIVILRPEPKPLLQFFSGLGVVCALSLIPDWQHYLFGERSVQAGAALPFVLSDAVFKETRELFFGMLVALPLVVGGIAVLWVNKPLRRFGIALFSIWLLTFRFAETTQDVPAQLVTYALLCGVAAMGIQMLESNAAVAPSRDVVFAAIAAVLVLLGVQLALGSRFTQVSTGLQTAFTAQTLGFAALALVHARLDMRLQRAGVVVLVALGAAATAYYTIPFMRATLIRELGDRALYEQAASQAKPDAILIGSYETSMRFRYYGWHDTSNGRWLSSGMLLGRGRTSAARQAEELARWKQFASEGRQVWVLSNADELRDLLQAAGYRMEAFKSIFHAEPWAD